MSPHLKNLQSEIEQNLKYLFDGLNAYNSSIIKPYSSSYRTLMQIGSSKLLCYADDGIPILIIPSHINKAYILDLNYENSFILELKNLGFKPYLLDWGELSQKEKGFGFEKYYNQRLLPVVEYINQKEKQKIIVAGYCMGGLFAIISSILAPNLIGGLVTLATPWNFHAKEFLVYPFSKNLAFMIYALCEYLPNIPKEFINLLFYFLRYNEVNQKYINFSKDKTRLEKFLDIENWANDGINMSTQLFRECMLNLVFLNHPYLNKWQVNEHVITPQKVTQKSFCAIPYSDKVCPFTSTIPLALELENCTVKEVKSGHISMIISKKHSIAPALSVWAKTNFG